MENKKTFIFDGQELFFSIGTYSNNRLAITCDTIEEPYSDITINLPNAFIDMINEAYLDPIVKDVGLQNALLEAGIIEKVISSDKYNMGTYDFVKFNFEKLKEYDPKGFEKFIEDIGFEEKICYRPKL